MAKRRVEVGGYAVELSMNDRHLQSLRSNWLYQRLRGQGQTSPAPSPKPINTSIDTSSAPIFTPPPPMSLETHESDSPERKQIIEQMRQVQFYHTVELPYGITTPGKYDHRATVALHELPESLAGQHVLDVATFDGFWSFELERRGAASVTAIDVARLSDCDLPPKLRQEFRDSGRDAETGAGFRITSAALNSKVDRRILSVYALSEESIGRSFDLVFCGDLLVHLRDPILAVQNIYKVARKVAIFSEPFLPELESAPNKYRTRFQGGHNHSLIWWMPSITVWEAMILGAGFRSVERMAIFRRDFTDGREGPWCVVLRAEV